MKSKAANLPVIQSRTKTSTGLDQDPSGVKLLPCNFNVNIKMCLVTEINKDITESITSSDHISTLQFI